MSGAPPSAKECLAEWAGAEVGQNATRKFYTQYVLRWEHVPPRGQP